MFDSKFKIIVPYSIFFLLVSCGGGGGGGSDSNVLPTPNPTASISISPSQIYVNDTIVIEWSSSNADSCNASGNWSGSKATSGNESFVVEVDGEFTYSISCSVSYTHLRAHET